MPYLLWGFLGAGVGFGDGLTGLPPSLFSPLEDQPCSRSRAAAVASLMDLSLSYQYIGLKSGRPGKVDLLSNSLLGLLLLEARALFPVLKVLDSNLDHSL